MKRKWPIALCCALLAAAAAADEPAGPNAELAAAAEALFEDLRRSSHSGPPDLPPILTLASDPTFALTGVQFHDSGVISRMRTFRQLSLLTFAEIGSATLFFGVNDGGLLGLHFGASRNFNPDRHLELARMPYLKPLAVHRSD